MPARAKIQPGSDAGYTLIELVISLTILALLLAMVPSTLKLGRRAWETPGQIRDLPAAATLAFASKSLEGAMPIYQRDSSGLQHLVFAGSQQSLSFVAELTSGPSGGGLYRIDLGPAQSGNGNRLSVRLSLYRSDIQGGTPAVEERDLAATYSAMQLRYFGAPSPGAAAQWLDQWPRSDRLPDLVDIVATPRAGSGAPAYRIRAELKLKPLL